MRRVALGTLPVDPLISFTIFRDGDFVFFQLTKLFLKVIFVQPGGDYVHEVWTDSLLELRLGKAAEADIFKLSMIDLIQLLVMRKQELLAFISIKIH